MPSSSRMPYFKRQRLTLWIGTIIALTGVIARLNGPATLHAIDAVSPVTPEQMAAVMQGCLAERMEVIGHSLQAGYPSVYFRFGDYFPAFIIMRAPPWYTENYMTERPYWIDDGADDPLVLVEIRPPGAYLDELNSDERESYHQRHDAVVHCFLAAHR